MFNKAWSGKWELLTIICILNNLEIDIQLGVVGGIIDHYLYFK